jgi:hydroxymethylpyrimidine/phosphomethylpyrimidine kinase
MKKIILSIAASDSSGGAGIHQDQRVAERLGFWCLNACTGVTTQSFDKLYEILPTDNNFFENQLELMFEKFEISAVKIGAICSDTQLRIIGQKLAKFTPRIVVVDPVLAPSKGKSFLTKESIEIYKKEVFPYTTLITPNIPELKQFYAIDSTNQNEILDFAEKLDLNLYLTGGHSNDENFLFEHLIHNNQIHRFRFTKKKWSYTHGTGCAFSTAVACYLALEKPIQQACIDSSNLVARLFDSLQSRLT